MFKKDGCPLLCFQNVYICFFFVYNFCWFTSYQDFFSLFFFFLPTDALKIPLRISVGEIEPGNYGADDFECENTICALNIRKQTSWDDFSKAVSQALTNHFQAISSDGWWSLEDMTFNSTTDSSIGLSASSVRSITLGISSPAMKGKLNFWVYLCLWAP